MYVVVLIANFAFTFFFTSATYLFFGVLYTAVAILGSVSFYDSAFSHFVIMRTLKSWDGKLDGQGILGKRLIASVAWLTFGIELSILIALVINFIGIGIMAIAIFIACQALMRGNLIAKAGKSVLIARAVVAVYQFFTSWVDRIVNFLIKQEFKLLKIETNRIN